MIFCPLSGNWCGCYTFDGDYKLMCSCEHVRDDVEVTVNECDGVVFEE